jgi:protocatechuate 3,4-dioxygenase beta subunit
VAGAKSGQTPGVRQNDPPGPGELTQTPWEIEGPYYRLGAPRRSNLLERGDQPELILTGRVLNPGGRPVAGAVVNFWQAKHLHVKVQAISRPVTTQLFLEGEPGNTADEYYNPALLVACTVDADGVKHGTFDFVVAQFTEEQNVTPASLAARA